MNLLRALKRMIFRGNVFVSYPKSRRTWMRYVVHLANVEVDFTHAGYGSTGRQMGSEFSGVKRGFTGRRNVFMHRNPLDTAVSLYFQVHLTDFHPGTKNYGRKLERLSKLGRLPPESIDEFVLHPVWGIRNVLAFNRAWLEHARANDFHIMTYEETRLHPETEIPKLLNFYGGSQVDMGALLEKVHFDRMQKLEAKGPSSGLKLQGKRDENPDSMKVRKGKIRGYADYLSPATIAACAEMAEKYEFSI